jgi:hypothetical protein
MRRWPAAAVVYSALTVLLALPLVRAFGSVIPHDAGDPVLNTWILWWSTRQVPFTAAWWDAPMFFPMRHALALSEVLIGLLPIAAPVQALTGNPLAAYNAVFLLSFPLSALAARALALDLLRGDRQSASTTEQFAAFAAGLAFAFAPYRMGQLSHVQMLSCYWTPVALLALHRYLAERRQPQQPRGSRGIGSRWPALFGVAWLAQSVSNGYTMFQLAILIALWLVWFVRSRRELLAIGGAWAIASLPLVPMLITYRNVHRTLHLVRDLNEVKRFSADLADFLSAPPELAVWGGRLLAAHAETALFPGVAVVAIGAVAVATRRSRGRTGADGMRLPRGAVAAAGLAIAAALVAASVLVVGPWAIGRLVTVSVFHKPFSVAVFAALAVLVQTPAFARAWRTHSVPAFYLISMLLMYVLALGPSPTLFGRPLLYQPPYAWLMRLPGFDVMRVPARFAMMAVLCQSMLVAIVLARWLEKARARATVQVLAVACVCAMLLADGWVRLTVVPLPSPAPDDWDDAAAVLELPAGKPELDFPAIYHGMFHGRPIVNGYSGYAPPHYIPLAHALRDGRYEAIEEIAAFGRIAVAIDNASAGSAETAHAIERLPGIERRTAPPGWTLFVVPRQPLRRAAAPGAPIALVRVEANRQRQDVQRLSDGSVESAWGSGAAQSGDEVITIELAAPQRVRAIVFRMGGFAFGYPRELTVEASPDGAAWSSVWSGSTAIPALHAALADPADVPLTISFAPAPARYLRLRQTGREPGIPWWIGELQVLSP